jgi:hypothetical protein
MARSCFFAAAFVLNVPRFLRFPVFGSFLREYSRYLSDFSFLIMRIPQRRAAARARKSFLPRLHLKRAALYRIFADQVDSACPQDDLIETGLKPSC